MLTQATLNSGLSLSHTDIHSDAHTHTHTTHSHMHTYVHIRTHTQVHQHTEEVKRGFVGKRQFSKQEKDESIMEEGDQNTLDNTLHTLRKLSKIFFFF